MPKENLFGAVFGVLEQQLTAGASDLVLQQQGHLLDGRLEEAEFAGERIKTAIGKARVLRRILGVIEQSFQEEGLELPSVEILHTLLRSDKQDATVSVTSLDSQAQVDPPPADKKDDLQQKTSPTRKISRDYTEARVRVFALTHGISISDLTKREGDVLSVFSTDPEKSYKTVEICGRVWPDKTLESGRDNLTVTLGTLRPKLSEKLHDIKNLNANMGKGVGGLYKLIYLGDKGGDGKDVDSSSVLAPSDSADFRLPPASDGQKPAPITTPVSVLRDVSPHIGTEPLSRIDELRKRIQKEVTAVCLTHLAVRGGLDISTNPLDLLALFIPDDISIRAVIGVDEQRPDAIQRIIDFIAEGIKRSVTEAKSKQLAQYTVVDGRIINTLNRIESRGKTFNVEAFLARLYKHFKLQVPEEYRLPTMQEKSNGYKPSPLLNRDGFLLRPPTLLDVTVWVERQKELRADKRYQSQSPAEQVAWELLNDFDSYSLLEDPTILVLNKPAGIPSHFGSRVPVGVEEIAMYLRGPQTRLAHRLDRDTTGVLVLAKSDTALFGLSNQFANKTEVGMRKIYWALLDGEFSDEEPREIDVPIASTETERMTVVTEGQDIQNAADAKQSLSIFMPLAILRSPFGAYQTLTEVQIITGRTHQIRVVAADYLHHPVVGDRLYDPEYSKSSRMMLHALELTFQHPIRGNHMDVQAPLPQEFLAGLQAREWMHMIHREEIERILTPRAA